VGNARVQKRIHAPETGPALFYWKNKRGNEVTGVSRKTYSRVLGVMERHNRRLQAGAKKKCRSRSKKTKTDMHIGKSGTGEKIKARSSSSGQRYCLYKRRRGRRCSTTDERTGGLRQGKKGRKLRGVRTCLRSRKYWRRRQAPQELASLPHTHRRRRTK